MTSEILIRELKNGEILFKVHENNPECVEFLIMEHGQVYGKGWGSGYGNGRDRLLELVTNPERWGIFGMNIKEEPPYPWGTTYNKEMLTSRLMLSDGAFDIAKRKNIIGSEYEKEYRDCYAMWQKSVEEEKQLRESQANAEHDYNYFRHKIRENGAVFSNRLMEIQEICSRGETLAKRVGIIDEK